MSVFAAPLRPQVRADAFACFSRLWTKSAAAGCGTWATPKNPWGFWVLPTWRKSMEGLFHGQLEDAAVSAVGLHVGGLVEEPDSFPFVGDRPQIL